MGQLYLLSYHAKFYKVYKYIHHRVCFDLLFIHIKNDTISHMNHNKPNLFIFFLLRLFDRSNYLHCHNAFNNVQHALDFILLIFHLHILLYNMGLIHYEYIFLLFLRNILQNLYICFQKFSCLIPIFFIRHLLQKL